ncbi:3-phenylpropionate/cinnamic acid dioxygenase small subunit [Nocardia sp. GAS34]|uniref:nuclear transport factor 2 family protein n=1 Tax=unclassified Nocardia TaxID=2637762 RepID=UPI003D1B48E2
MLDITAADRIAIHEAISLHGHIADDRDWDRWGELYTDDLVLDLEDFGLGTTHGLAALEKMARDNQDDPAQPLGHHVTNTVLVAQEGDRVRARSKGLAVNADGTSGTVVYEDTLRRESNGWRICQRKVLARRAPGPA